MQLAVPRQQQSSSVTALYSSRIPAMNLYLPPQQLRLVTLFTVNYDSSHPPNDIKSRKEASPMTLTHYSTPSSNKTTLQYSQPRRSYPSNTLPPICQLTPPTSNRSSSSSLRAPSRPTTRVSRRQLRARRCLRILRTWLKRSILGVGRGRLGRCSYGDGME